MKDKAVVLGGGGPVGIAWEIGVAAGLASQGILLGEAGLILGTSAGSFVGAQLASGGTPDAFAAAQIELGRRPAPPAAGAQRPAPSLEPLMGFIGRFPPDGEPSLALRMEIGKFARESQTLSEDQFVSGFQVLTTGGDQWSERFACTAVDTETGEFKIWRKEDSVPLPAAVASSCAVPGIFPAISLKGKKWMDGGMRSATNVDYATGYQRVLVLAVVVGSAMAAWMRPRIEREAAVLVRAGSQVQIIVPDDSAAAACGGNLMDASNRAAITEAGIAQGKREAARLREFWQ